MTAIYKYLSHYYILKRSIVFIVDTNYDNMAYGTKSADLISEYFDSMPLTDHFGYISLDGSPNNSIPLESKGNNTKVKRTILQRMRDIKTRILSRNMS